MPNPPIGCSFHTRYPVLKDICTTEKPQWEEYTSGHFVACHYAVTSIVSGRGI
ncbi:hypothetical protein [Viridibacillus arvi]|uniref:hypothetical protein n=1 Tax=Viridibacillus arvi TaxID=263475 RepID=UPI001FE14D8A|nr:hypothetical protein [Viridibacillus arvi]